MNEDNHIIDNETHTPEDSLKYNPNAGEELIEVLKEVEAEENED